MPWGPYSTSLPTTGSPAKHMVDDAAWDAVIDNFVTWKGNVNGGGFTLSNVLISGAVGLTGLSASLNFPSIPSGESKVLSFTATGALTGSGHACFVNPPTGWDDEVSWSARISAPDTIKIIVANHRADGSEYDPPAGQWGWVAF